MKQQLGVLFFLLAGKVAAADTLQLAKNDHICVIGNVLAERMQHDGWLETFVQHRFPEHQLVFRNLGFSGDEPSLRLRSPDFGSPDEWLTRCQADVVLAFFGFNESFSNDAGLEAFHQDLAGFIKHTRGQKYNGTSAPRLVLFSPIACEDLQSPNLPDPAERNRRLEKYTRAMSEVAMAHGVTFVDLFQPTLRQYETVDEPLTINGHYLNERGNHAVATVIDGALFSGQPPFSVEASRLERLRQAVVDKNFYWYHRYRTTDGFNVFGGRSHMRYTDDVSNREVMQREMEILDVMAANRDRRVWAVANGNDVEVDDGITPPFIPVKTNKPGPHEFLSGEEAIEKMSVAEGMQVNLIASDEMFPELINPVQMAFDPRGRLVVAVWPSYPHWTPKDEMNDKLLILEDTDGDGRADQCKTFADGLNNPTGFEFWGGGVLVAMAPDLLFLKDTNGDDVADVRVRVLHGIDSADTHHTANCFVLGPDGALYFQEGTFHQSQIETVNGVHRNNNGCVWRFEPRTWKVDRYVAFNFANPHGHAFNRWGQDFVHDGTGAVPYHAALFSGHLEYPAKHSSPPRLYAQRTRPCPATEILSSRHFPEDNQGNLLVANVIGVLGILQYEISEIDSSFDGTELEPILTSTDPNFRPSDLEIGPDGAIYFVDWQNPIIGHLQHHIRDPNRDKTHGRVYRITYPGRPLLNPPKIEGAAVGDLLQLLKEPEDRFRYRVRIELSGRDTDEVIPAVQNFVRGLYEDDPDYGHHILEALWLHQQHNVVDQDLLRRLLQFPDHRVRAAATRVLCYWRDRVSEPLELLKQQAADEHPHVRLQAVRAASFLKAAEAIDVPLLTTAFPSDPYIEFTRGETMRALEPYWRRALDEEHEIAVTSDAARRFLLQNTSTQRLLKTKRDRAVYREILFRDGLLDEHRREAVAGLADLENTSQLRVLLDAIANLDERQQSQSVVFDLVRLLTGRTSAELSSVRDDLVEMATGAKLPVVRQIGFVVLIAADESVDEAWQLASGDVATLRDLVSAMPLIVDPSVRANLYPQVAPLLSGLPASLASSEDKHRSAALGRYVRVELPGRRRVLTLAEVEVYSDGQNVARHGKASQKNTASGGQPERGIDGNKKGDYSAGGQTHTRQTRNPWWELDLGQEYPIDSIAIYNRTEGSLGERLEGFTLTVFDASRRKIFEQKKNSAPARSVAFEIGGGGPEAVIRRAAMNAVTYVRGKETETYHSLATLIRDDVDRTAAIRAMQRIPRRFWPEDEAGALLRSILAYVRAIPVEDRTSPSAQEAMQFADALAALLPSDEALAARAELGDLGVRVIRIGTLPHRMAYDTERIVVEAGKPVEFIFENTDLMPHNFVITKPGALEEIGLLAESTAQQPDALGRHYVPRSEQILLASTLLSPSQSEVLSYVAPEAPGVYPFVCTYPGHWRRMFGALYVVDDLDRYHTEPEAYLANNPLPVLDELLKFNRPRTEWSFEELASSVRSLSHGRSFGGAKQIFEVASCVACHRMNGAGLEIGPDLTKLDPKWQSAEILQEVLDPSKQINEKYFNYTFLLDTGKVVTGLVIQETPDNVTVIENPLANAEPIVLEKTEIESRQKSTVSIMPKGLLDKLTREEILDLIAYVSSRGDPKHKFFSGEHAHGAEH